MSDVPTGADGSAQPAEPLDTEAWPRTEVIERWRAAGFDVRFEIVAGGRVRCETCGTEVEPEEVTVEETGRYEGISDPEDEELLLAVRCPQGHGGTLTLGYGAYASADEAEAARRLPDAPRR